MSTVFEEMVTEPEAYSHEHVLGLWEADDTRKELGSVEPGLDRFDEEYLDYEDELEVESTEPRRVRQGKKTRRAKNANHPRNQHHRQKLDSAQRD